MVRVCTTSIKSAGEKRKKKTNVNAKTALFAVRRHTRKRHKF